MRTGHIIINYTFLCVLSFCIFENLLFAFLKPHWPSGCILEPATTDRHSHVTPIPNVGTQLTRCFVSPVFVFLCHVTLLRVVLFRQFTPPYYALFCFVSPRNPTRCFVSSVHVTLLRVVLFRQFTSLYALFCFVSSRHPTRCFVSSVHVTLRVVSFRQFMSPYALFRFVSSCFFLCHVTLPPQWGTAD